MGEKGIGETGMTYIYEKVAESLTGEQKMFANAYTEWGHMHEPIAAEWYEKITGEQTKVIGFLPYEDYAGCTPDRQVERTTRLIEIKCPANTDNHVRLFAGLDNLKKAKKEYYWQIQMQLLIGGLHGMADAVDLVVYDPRIDLESGLIIKTFYPDAQDQELLIDRLAQAEIIKKGILINYAKYAAQEENM